MGPAGAASLLRTASFASSLLSAAFLVTSLVGQRWAPIALASIAVLILLGVIRSASRKVAYSYGERVALRIAPTSEAVSWPLTPLLAIQAMVLQRILRFSANQAASSAEAIAAGMALSSDSRTEPLDEREVRMIRAVLGLDEATAREIMVPRVDMVAADIKTPIARLAEDMVRTGHSRIPVYDGDLDHIEGVVHARDILSHPAADRESSEMLSPSMVHPAFYIPESKTLKELLRDFQQERVHMAIVIDEYGGVAGLVTIEDLLEEIVGEIQDEFDTSGPAIELVGDNEYVVDARTSIDDLNELLGVSVEQSGFHTMGGFVYHRLGKIPSPGDSVAYDGLKIEVISTVGRRLKKLRITRFEVPSSRVG